MGDDSIEMVILHIDMGYLVTLPGIIHFNVSVVTSPDTTPLNMVYTIY
jgi:hypothetical protein